MGGQAFTFSIETIRNMVSWKTSVWWFGLPAEDPKAALRFQTGNDTSSPCYALNMREKLPIPALGFFSARYALLTLGQLSVQEEHAIHASLTLRNFAFCLAGDFFWLTFRSAATPYAWLSQRSFLIAVRNRTSMQSAKR